PAGSSPGLLTTRGWALAAGNLALLIAGRLLGVRELFELGLGLSTLVIAACIVVRRGGHDTRLARAVDPLEVYPGTLVRVEVSIRAGARRSPPLLFVEELPADLADGVPRAASSAELHPVDGPTGTLPTAGGAELARRPGRRAIAFPVGAIEAPPAPGADAVRRGVLHHAGVPAGRRREEDPLAHDRPAGPDDGPSGGPALGAPGDDPARRPPPRPCPARRRRRLLRGLRLLGRLA